jgi:AcrR family transcriptional regulator
MTTALRQDAQRNRELILAAAADEFREHGLEVSLEEIARRAGVGIGTLYRRFPTRDALIEAVFEHQVQSFVALAEEALKVEDPWVGFSGFVEQLCERQAADYGLKDLLCTRLPDAKAMELVRTRGRTLISKLIDRAQAAGVLRADVTPSDIEFVLWSNKSVVEATRDIAPNAWRRNVALLLDGFRAENAHELPERALTPSELSRSMTRRAR